MASVPTFRPPAWSQRLEVPVVRFERLDAGRVRIAMDGSRPLLVEGKPEVPFLSRRLAIPSGKTGRARLADERYSESGPVDPVLVPEPHVWGAGALTFDDAPDERWFPGRSLAASEGGGELVVTVFPVQFDRRTHRVRTLLSADLEVDWLDRAPAPLQVDALFDTPSLIVTAERMMAAATKLQRFHWERFGIGSEIVTVETIGRAEEPIGEEDLPQGYKSREAADRFIEPYAPATGKGYHYDLARRIARYLGRRMGDDGARAVTILGDASVVPPSYYYSSRSGAGAQFTATDHCYSARAKCLEPRLALGRLPFRTPAEVDGYLAKAARWLDTSARASSELAVFGGKGFPGDVFLGELAALKVVNLEGAGWRGLGKYLRSNGAYSTARLLDAVSGNGRSALLYHVDHGAGNQWFVEHEFLSTKAVRAIAGPGAGELPFVVSISCTAAANDESLVRVPFLEKPEHGEESVGVALLKSPAGAIGFVGSARPAIGTPVFAFDARGNLDLRGTNYALQILDGVLERYQAAAGGRAGELVRRALVVYTAERGNDFRNPRHRWTYFNTAYLGDPLLPLPDRRGREPAYPAARSESRFDLVQPPLFPKWYPPAAGTPLALDLEAPARTVGSLYRVVPGDFEQTEELVARKSYPAGRARLEFSPPKADGEQQYLLKLENDEGVPVERQVWFRVGSRD